MGDSLITVVAIALVAGLLFFVPLMTMADNVDTTTQTVVETIVSDFVDEIATTGVITQAKYDKFQEKLLGLGYTFNTDIEIKVLDENPGKKTSQTAKDKIGENVYYSEYTTQILEELEQDGAKTLSTGSIILVNVHNTDLTFSQQLKQFMYKIVGNDNATLVASESAMIH